MLVGSTEHAQIFNFKLLNSVDGLIIPPVQYLFLEYGATHTHTHTHMI